MNGQPPKHQKRQGEAAQTPVENPVRSGNQRPPEDQAPDDQAPDDQTRDQTDGQVIAEKGDALGGPA
jgi:hypothetical protein